MKILIVVLLTILCLNAKSINTTNYEKIAKVSSSSEIFYKVCLEGVIYWVYSSLNPENKSQGKGGISVYYNSNTLSPQRCKLTNIKCLDNKPMFGTNIKEVCYRQFKELK